MKKWLLAILLLCAAPVFAAPHGRHFTWVQSVTPGITSNTFYCGVTSGVYTLVWPLPVSVQFDWVSTDIVNPPVQGQKYYCAVTASITGIESGYSNEVSFTFPVVPVPGTGLSSKDF